MNDNRKKKRKAGPVIMFIAIMAIGAVVGYLGGYLIGQTGGVGFWFLLILIISLCLAYILQIVIHEAGHLVCGLLSGYRFVSFRVGSFMIARCSGKMEFRRYSLVGTGGQCLLVPPDMEAGWIPYKLYNLGGVLFNFLTAGLFFIIWHYIARNTPMAALCLFNALFGVAGGLMNGLPLRLGGVDNDGRNMVSLGKHPESLRAFWLQLKVNAVQMEGTRLKDMPAEWFALSDDWPRDNSVCTAVAVMACSRAVDRMEFERAARMAAALMDEKNDLIPLYSNILTIELIFAELVGENRKEELDQMWTKGFDKFLKAMKNYPAVIRLQYGYELLANGDGKAALKKQQEFEKVARSYPFAGDLKSEREIMDYAEKLVKVRAEQAGADADERGENDGY